MGDPSDCHQTSTDLIRMVHNSRKGVSLLSELKHTLTIEIDLLFASVGNREYTLNISVYKNNLFPFIRVKLSVPEVKCRLI